MSLLEVHDVTVRFGGLTANDQVNFAVEKGAIDGLVGPNGAGKTTLFNVITGAQVATSGHVTFDGDDFTTQSRIERARAGVARTFQNLSLVPRLSVLENVVIGLGRYRRCTAIEAMLHLPRSIREDRRLRTLAMEALDFVGLVGAAHLQAGDLSYGDRRRTEIARALALGPRLLLLDEPSAGMDPAETEALAETIRRAAQGLGVTVLLVEHDMSFVRLLCQRTSVLDFGRIIAAGQTEEVLSDPAVADAYLGGGEVTHA